MSLRTKAAVLATALLLATTAGAATRIDIDCASGRALERALARAAKIDEVDIYLHGVCRGNFVIAHDGVTLRAAMPGSGVAAREGDPRRPAVLEVVDATASLRGITVRGGEVGVHVHGWNASVLLFEVEVHDQEGVGVIASRGAELRVLDSTLRDARIGLLAQSHADANLQRVVVSRQDVGVVVSGGSFAALNDTTVEHSRQGGLNVDDRSDVNVLGGVFRDNGEVHVNANDWSSVRLLSGVVVGSEADPTPYALGVARDATITSFTTPALHGSVSALIGGSMRLGETVIHGDLVLVQFADAFVRNAEITGTVFCVDGAEAICRQTTTAGSSGCPSPSCGAPVSADETAVPAPPEIPEIEVPQVGERLPSRR